MDFYRGRLLGYFENYLPKIDLLTLNNVMTFFLQPPKVLDMLEMDDLEFLLESNPWLDSVQKGLLSIN